MEIPFLFVLRIENSRKTRCDGEEVMEELRDRVNSKTLSNIVRKKIEGVAGSE